MKGSKGFVQLVQYEEVRKKIKTATDCIVFQHVNGSFEADVQHSIKDNPDVFRICILNLKPEERALITKVSLLYTHNDLEDTATFDVDPLFESSPFSPLRSTAHSGSHPDEEGGRSVIVVPGNYHRGVVDGEYRAVYEPMLVHLGINILQYAGMESHIINARSSYIGPAGLMNGPGMFFLATDPLLVFLLNHKHHFKNIDPEHIRCVPSECGSHGGVPVYVVHKELVARVQSFFQTSIFPLLNYTNTDAIQFRWSKDGCPQVQDNTHPVIMMMMSVDYITMSTTALTKFESISTQLNI